MNNDFDHQPLNEVSILDEAYLQNWEASIGKDMMPVFIADLMNTFEEHYKTTFAEITAACQGEQKEQLTKQMHFIKGSLGNIGLSRASAFARQAEIELRSDKFNRYDTFPDRLESYVAEGLSELRKRY